MPQPTDNKQSSEGAPSFATILVDYSASFAPLTQTDRLALKETARALADLAVQEWNPPTTVVWRKIGTSSISPPLLCDILEYKRSIVGAASAAERLRDQLSTCAETVVRNSGTQQEPYTDISSAIMMAAQNWRSINGRKAIIILSDGQEDLPKGQQPTSLRLHGETIVLLHRPGTSEAADPIAYLERITAWKARLIAAGARQVAILPAFRATLPTVEQALTDQPDNGTSISLLNDLTPANDAVTKHAIATLAAAIANRATSYPAPVRAGWFGIARPAWRTAAVAPVVFMPRLVRRPNEHNTANDFKTALEEPGFALLKRQDVGNGDIDGALRLIMNSETASRRYLIVLSSLSDVAPTQHNPSLLGATVLLVYQPSKQTDGATFFQRLDDWQGYFRRAGVAQVCALDLATLTEATIASCLP
jgi:hypothetical protein